MVLSSLVSHKASAFPLQKYVSSSNYLCTQAWHSLELWAHFPTTAWHLWAASAPVSSCSSSALFWQPECQASSCVFRPLSPRAFFLLFLPCRSSLCPEMSAVWRHLTVLSLPPPQAYLLAYQDSISPWQMLSTLAPASRFNSPFVTTNTCTGVSIIQLFIPSVPSVLKLQQKILVYLLIWVLGNQLLFLQRTALQTPCPFQHQSSQLHPLCITPISSWCLFNPFITNSQHFTHLHMFIINLFLQLELPLLPQRLGLFSSASTTSSPECSALEGLIWEPLCWEITSFHTSVAAIKPYSCPHAGIHSMTALGYAQPLHLSLR